MPSKKRKAKAPHASTQAQPSTSPSRVTGAAAAIGVAIALGSTYLLQTFFYDGAPLSSEGLLAMVRKSDLFELVKDTRTLSAVSDIPAGTLLMEIPRELMV